MGYSPLPEGIAVVVNVALVVVAGTLVVLGLTARLAKKSTLSPFLLAVAVGAVLGPQATGIVDVAAQADPSQVLEQTSRVALALSVTSIGFRLQLSDLRADARRVVGLLTIGMVVMWLVSSLGAWLLLGLPWQLALLLGAVLTPTDPAVASTLVQGVLAERMLPQRLRMTLETESGANDGLAVMFVLVAALLVPGVGPADGADLTLAILREVGIPLVLGPAIGYTVGRLTRYARAAGTVEETFLPILAPATSLLVLGLVGLLGGSGVLAAFLAGLAMSWVAEDPAARESISIAQENFTKVATTVCVPGLRGDPSVGDVGSARADRHRLRPVGAAATAPDRGSRSPGRKRDGALVGGLPFLVRPARDRQHLLRHRDRPVRTAGAGPALRPGDARRGRVDGGAHVDRDGRHAPLCPPHRLRGARGRDL